MLPTLLLVSVLVSVMILLVSVVVPVMIPLVSVLMPALPVPPLMPVSVLVLVLVLVLLRPRCLPPECLHRQRMMESHQDRRLYHRQSS